MAGRKPHHEFNTLEIGQKTALKGKARLYPFQYAHQYNKKGDRQIKIIKEGKSYIAERVK